MRANLRLGARLLALGALLGAATLTPAPAAADAPLLDAMFQDHAVLQRDRPIAVWGHAGADAQLTITFNGKSVRAAADRAGAWRAMLPATPAGGPYTVSVRARSGAAQTITDVLVGDVFLCSGQSNMELPVRASLRADAEIAQSANDRIRLFTVAHAASATPLSDFTEPASWAAAGPDTVGSFSAACYYFARELQHAVDVPIGLIHASWGGSAIAPWISAQGLRAAGGFDQYLDLLSLYAHDRHSAYARMGALWEAWWRSAAPNAGEPWAPGASGDWRALPEPMRDWKTWGVPETANLNGMVWFTRVVTLSAAQAAQAARLSLGAIDEVDQTWVNGEPIANSFGWGAERSYDVPAGVLHAGENTIVVNVLSTWDMGGMYGPPEHMQLAFANGEAAPLGGDWRYQLAPAGIGYPPRAPWESIGGLTTLYNGMIAPIGAYGVRAVAWYQGESNTGDASSYQSQLAALMSSWRRQFGAATPFLIVQLPNFGPAPIAPAASGWADVREAERRAVAADAHAGLVVTIDIGDRNELHPQNKQAVGRRLARAARHVVYGEDISPSGPQPVRARRDGADIVVSFTGVDGALVAYSARGPMAFELCGAAQDTCRYAEATIRGDDVVISDDGRAATRVRHCWGDGPVCNLYDGAGMPAGPFELAIE
jgi:sialate O-acetylesterase